uniref:Phospholipase A2 n=1 Tax=Monopterus albus TaxID=43700 RepID=A0A3Q3JXT7_MONAL|nr:phospholipase A2, minor isoenzyme-like isoform X2 [Monopterus albus]XP_020446121.1 phospholipase A2, minor isoenzyme-like isoform X3 [Monopterus albus]XP_020446123.1 phospholipase A2, minor isoenzyme-like isoform X3 [Monopterus albus]
MNLAAALVLLLTAHMASGALWQLGVMISCVQPGVNPLAYDNYGCWCGIGGGVGAPRDEVDMCCQVHDKCYDTNRNVSGCDSLMQHPYILVYGYTCSNQQVTCSATNNRCQAAVCECDRAAAECFAKATYNPENKKLDHKADC